jgi:hypothetical protein
MPVCPLRGTLEQALDALESRTLPQVSRDLRAPLLEDFSSAWSAPQSLLS